MKNARDVLRVLKTRGSKHTRQESTFFRDFFQASCQAVTTLGNFLLLNKKDEEFKIVCERMKQMFEYSDPKQHFLRIPEEFYQRHPMRLMIFAELTGDYRETRKKSRKLIEKVGRIEKAEDISQVKADVESLRNRFYNLSTICFEVVNSQKEKGSPYKAGFAFAS